MPNILYWIAVLLISGISYPGTDHYATEDDCKEAIKQAVEYNLHMTCLPIYKRKSEEPQFRCGDLACPAPQGDG